MWAWVNSTEIFNLHWAYSVVSLLDCLSGFACINWLPLGRKPVCLNVTSTNCTSYHHLSVFSPATWQCLNMIRDCRPALGSCWTRVVKWCTVKSMTMCRRSTRGGVGLVCLLSPSTSTSSSSHWETGCSCGAGNVCSIHVEIVWSLPPNKGRLWKRASQ